MANKSELKPVQYIKPFTKFCMTIGNLPSTYLESMTYYEQILWLIKFLEDTVIPTINNNSEAVDELQQNVIDFENNITNQQNNFETTIMTLYNNLKNYVDNYFDNLDVQEEINNKLDQMAEDGELQEIMQQIAGTKLNNSSSSNQVELSDNLLTDPTKWNGQGGWTGSPSSGFHHIVGQTIPLIYNDTFEVGQNYVLSFDVTSQFPAGSQNASNAFSVVLGNSEPIITYRGGGSMHYDIGLTPKENGNLQFVLVSPVDPTQSSDIFDGVISNITLKRVTATLHQIDFADRNNRVSNAVTLTPYEDNNTIIGAFSGITNYKQQYNTYFGKDTAYNDLTGYFNVGIGYRALFNNRNGSRNVSIGYMAHSNNISGDRNIAIGSFPMTNAKTTRRTISLGFDSMFDNESGDNNIAIGGVALSGAVNSVNNIAIGHSALSIPHNTTLQDRNIAIGNLSQWYNTSGTGNISLGHMAFYRNASGRYNIIIGTQAVQSLQDGNSLISIGNIGNALTSANSSFVGGTSLINQVQTLTQSSILGYNITTNTTTSIVNSTLIGRNITSTLSELTNVHVFGNNIQVTKNNMVYLGGIITMDLSNTSSLKRVGIGVNEPSARLHIMGGSNLSQTAPIKIDPGTLMTSKEDGAIEYDGTNLYFTIGTTRHTIAFSN